MPSATIKLFLVHGDPRRLRTAELSNWNGKAVAGPRSEFDGILSREESASAGVYLLTGADAETGKPKVYVGEAEKMSARLKSHLQKDFWNQLVYFISKDENLTKAHIRYLEGRLIEQAQAADRAIVANGQSSGSRLPESDREDMEIFLQKVNQLLPVVGVDLLVPSVSDEGPTTRERVLTCQIKGLNARGHLTPEGFVVLAGSQAVLEERASTKKWPWASNMRQELLEAGILAPKDDHMEFLRNVEFSSPSAAATVVHGGQANGLLSWKDDTGKTLKEIESA